MITEGVFCVVLLFDFTEMTSLKCLNKLILARGESNDDYLQIS